ncbi:hypothetical protein GH714_022478 [Hevea brasiliensis]|uniref:Cytochrome P450 n=1 Tax=Hevea brasiliensis TaxID=3981 RepID=A0A6A6MP19_HEVBR|nr:hypothetical protein GH714_022478 [Hevea brasiliensis]
MHHLVGSLPHHRLRDLAKKYGPLMHLQLGEVTNIVISSPETAKEVMKTHDVIFAQRPFLLAASIVGYDFSDIAFAPYGNYWRQMRKICTLELLTAKRVQSFRSIREEEISKLIRTLSSGAGSPINFSRMFNSLTYSVTSRAAFGKIWKGEEIFIPTVKKLIQLAGGFSLADIYPSIKLLHVISTVRPKLERLHQIADKILESIIYEHRARKAAAKSGADYEEEDFVDVLLNLQDRAGLEFPLTNDNIKGVILDMFIAGSETSSTTLEWAMSEMLKNPRVMEKAQAEVRQVFGVEGNIDEERLHELNYLKMLLYYFDWKLPAGLTPENLDMVEVFGAVVKRKMIT